MNTICDRSLRWRAMALLLVLAMLSGLAACGAPQTSSVTPTPAQTAAPASRGLPEMEQRRILEENRALWEFADPYASPWFYTFTDLDHNGRLEVLAASTQGSGIFTYVQFYEVREDFTGVQNLYHEGVEIEGPDDWPEIILESLPCYYDSASDSYYYVCEGILRNGAAHQNVSCAALCLKNGVADWEYLGWMDLQWVNGGEGPLVSCTDAVGNTISEAAYNALAEQRFAGFEKSELRLNWIEVDQTAPEPEGTEPVPATPTPAPAGTQVLITKNPTSEALAVGGQTWFIAHAENADSLTWELLDPNGAVYSLAEAMAANPGLTLEAMEEDTLAISKVPLSVNGWSVRARFDGQGTAYTTPASLYVGDYVNLYDSVIQAYRAAYETGNRTLQYAYDHGISEIIEYSAHVGYAFKDLDKDGVPELIIAGIDTDDFSAGMVYDLYTLYNGAPVQLAISQARNRWYLRSDSLLYNEASGGASRSFRSLYRKTGTELSGIRCVFTWPNDSEGVEFRYQEGTVAFGPCMDDELLSEEAFNAKVKELEGTRFLPPLTRIA